MKTIHSFRFAAVSAALFTLTACGGGGYGESPEETGHLTLGLTDGPVESAKRVVVAFTGVQLKAADESAPMDPIVFNEDSCDDFDAATGTCSIDLLQLTGDTRKVVFSQDLPAGLYEWVRLLVDADLNEIDTFIELDDGTICSAWIPSGAETGLKIVGGITVTGNGVSDYTLDFEVRKSLTAPPGLATGSAEACAQNYILKPAIRIIDTTQVGTIAGTVDENLLTDAGCVMDESSGLFENVAVYIFENFDGTAVADDIDDEMDNANPITTASVVFDGDPAVNAYTFEAGFLLAPEDYLAAVTCTAHLDGAESDDFDPSDPTASDFSFIAERTVTTEVDATVDASF